MFDDFDDWKERLYKGAVTVVLTGAAALALGLLGWLLLAASPWMFAFTLSAMLVALAFVLRAEWAFRRRNSGRRP